VTERILHCPVAPNLSQFGGVVVFPIGVIAIMPDMSFTHLLTPSGREKGLNTKAYLQKNCHNHIKAEKLYTLFFEQDYKAT